MCGITGVVDYKNRSATKSLLLSMANTLYHRGPDAHGVLIAEDGKVGLASQRLQIIDLSPAGRMPMSNEDGTVHITYNGEIYNYGELRLQLIKTHRFKSQTDTETILHLYEDEGIDCVRQLDGMFAFAIWDAKKKLLVMARDRCGKKPLYYYFKDGLLVFASEIKAIIQHPQVVTKINESIIPHYLAYGYAPTPHTFYQHIYKLPPASTLTLNERGHIQLKEYWDWNFCNEPITVTSKEAISKVQELLTQAVMKRLVSDVPLGVFLSGGIDSSVIVALMSQLVSSNVKTLSIGFVGADSFNEAPYARIVSDYFKTDHSEFLVAPDNFDLIHTLLEHYDEPFGDSSALPTYIVSKLAKQSVTVVLNGDGGDEVFAGYQRFLGAQILSYYRLLPTWVNSALLRTTNAIFPDSRQSYYHWSSKAKRFFGHADNPILQAYLSWVSYFYAQENYRILQPRFHSSISNISQAYKEIFERQQTSLLSRLLYLNFKTYLPDDLLIKVDRMSSANALEARSPFLDQKLLEYLALLPDRAKIRRWTLKYILKKSFAAKIPQAIIKRKKHGFGVPLSNWFRKELRSYIRAELLNDNARVHHYVCRQRLEEIINEHVAAKKDWGQQLWLLLTLELWLKKCKML